MQSIDVFPFSWYNKSCGFPVNKYWFGSTKGCATWFTCFSGFFSGKG